MQTLKVECRVANVWSPPAFGVHLDGLIGWALVNQAKQSGGSSLDFNEILADMPFVSHVFPSGERVWQASILTPTGVHGLERRMMTSVVSPHKMFRLVDRGVVSEKGGKWEGVRGPEKNSQIFYTTQRISGLQAWCVGDADAIAYLLNEIRAVGSRTRIGMGALMPFDDGAFWRVTPCKEAETLWALRNLPSIEGVPSLPRYADVGAYQPPYWEGSSVIYRPILNDYMTYLDETKSPDEIMEVAQ